MSLSIRSASSLLQINCLVVIALAVFASFVVMVHAGDPMIDVPDSSYVLLPTQLLVPLVCGNAVMFILLCFSRFRDLRLITVGVASLLLSIGATLFAGQKHSDYHRHLFDNGKSQLESEFPPCTPSLSIN